VTAQGCTFSSNKKGDGAIFFDQTTATLIDNSFDSNGEVVGPTTGLNGLEFNGNFTGTAVVSGNTFQNNTADGLFIGNAPNTIQVVNNLFDNNLAGIVLYSSGTTISVNIQSNTFQVPATAPSNFFGFLAIGSGASATIGGPGGQGNDFNGFADHTSIGEANAGGPQNQFLGCPNVTILANTFQRDGVTLQPSQAINPC
jgi:hypothetical protein